MNVISWGNVSLRILNMLFCLSVLQEINKFYRMLCKGKSREKNGTKPTYVNDNLQNKGLEIDPEEEPPQVVMSAKVIWKRAWKDFCETTSIQGLRQIREKQTFPCRRYATVHLAVVNLLKDNKIRPSCI